MIVKRTKCSICDCPRTTTRRTKRTNYIWEIIQSHHWNYLFRTSSAVSVSAWERDTTQEIECLKAVVVVVVELVGLGRHQQQSCASIGVWKKLLLLLISFKRD